MIIRLTWCTGYLRGKTASFNSLPVTIGSDLGNALYVDSEREPQVAAFHCKIYEQDGQIWLRDNGSANGTLVNGRRIQGAAQLRLGDQLQLGSQGPLFELGQPVPQAPPPAAPPAAPPEAAPAQAETKKKDHDTTVFMTMDIPEKYKQKEGEGPAVQERSEKEAAAAPVPQREKATSPSPISSVSQWERGTAPAPAPPVENEKRGGPTAPISQQAVPTARRQEVEDESLKTIVEPGLDLRELFAKAQAARAAAGAAPLPVPERPPAPKPVAPAPEAARPLECGGLPPPWKR